MANQRTWMLFNMRKNNNVEFTKSEKALVEEITQECFGKEIPMTEISDMIILQRRMNNLKSVMDGTEKMKPTIPGPKPDILIKPLKIIIRVNGLIHQTSRARIKDDDQKFILEGNGYDIIDVNFEDREDLWE